MRKLMESVSSLYQEEPIVENNNSDAGERADELEAIQEQIMELTEQALSLLDGIDQTRARSYWYGHIMSAVGSDSYFSGSATSMRDSIDALREEQEEADMYGPQHGLDDEDDEDPIAARNADERYGSIK